MLKVEGLTRRFGALVAVDSVSFEVPKGQMVGIIGRSGAGKSTLLRMINRLTEATSGSVACDGVDVLALKGRAVREWRAQCAMVFQQFNLVPRLSVMTNVLMGRISYHGTLPTLLMMFSDADRALAIRALQRLDMVSHGLHRADELSGGQQQRVAVARAVGGSPSILLADEPTGNLDSKNGEAVMELLHDLHKEGATICMVTHDPRYARNAERSIHLFDGRVVEEDAARTGQKDLEESGFHLNS